MLGQSAGGAAAAAAGKVGSAVRRGAGIPPLLLGIQTSDFLPQQSSPAKPSGYFLYHSIQMNSFPVFTFPLFWIFRYASLIIQKFSSNEMWYSKVLVCTVSYSIK